MFLKKLFRKSEDYSSQIDTARKWINEADALVIGIGEGVSAASGLDHARYHLVKAYFYDYYRMGFRSLAELNRMYTQITPENAKAYWGYWARYIKYISYEREVGNGYRDLLRLIRNKNYMIYTTNIDSQVQKVGFKEERVFAQGGDGRFLKCSQSCTQKLYDSMEILEPMIKSMEGNLEIKANKIPRCPHCGEYLIPNIQDVDWDRQREQEAKETVNEQPMQNESAFYDFVQKYSQEKIVFLELGMDPSIRMRTFFEEQMRQYDLARLIRVHEEEVSLSDDLKTKAIGIRMNLEEAIAEVASGIVSL